MKIATTGIIVWVAWFLRSLSAWIDQRNYNENLLPCVGTGGIALIFGLVAWVLTWLSRRADKQKVLKELGALDLLDDDQNAYSERLLKEWGERLEKDFPSEMFGVAAGGFVIFGAATAFFGYGGLFVIVLIAAIWKEG